MSQQTPPPINIPDQPMAIITMAEYLALKETERRYEKEMPPEEKKYDTGPLFWMGVGMILAFVIRLIISIW